ncbi:MAG: NAD(P)/FAD-dependent oxidoreductase [Gemmatimonadota bacterium]
MRPARRPAYDAAVIGGGAIGVHLALYLSRHLSSVVLLERESELLRRASYANQARVHNGYHYPRSLLTALRSRVNFPRFLQDYADCVDESDDHYYAVGRLLTKTTAAQFLTFCRRIGVPAEPAPREVKALFAPHLVEGVFRVREAVFDAGRLRARLVEELRLAGVEVRCGVEARRVRAARGTLELETREAGTREVLDARHVFNCTYARLNEILAASELPLLPLKHELTELALVELPPELAGKGLTLMDGPFFSILPFPARPPLHSVSHVRYTPHAAWRDGTNGTNGGHPDAYEVFRRARLTSRFAHMRHDIRRYLPALDGARHVDSLWEVKTVLPSSEVDDSRPMLFRRDQGLPNLACVFGGKIDNVYDVLAELEELRARGWLR